MARLFIPFGVLLATTLCFEAHAQYDPGTILHVQTLPNATSIGVVSPRIAESSPSTSTTPAIVSDVDVLEDHEIPDLLIVDVDLWGSTEHAIRDQVRSALLRLEAAAIADEEITLVVTDLGAVSLPTDSGDILSEEAVDFPGRTILLWE